MKRQYPSALCPRFDACSVNNCPLDPEYPNLIVHPDDRQKTCPIEKQVRIRIAASFPELLPFAGRTRMEHAGKLRFEALPPAVKTQMAEAGKARLAALRKDKSP